ncbi:MAG TPA: hypothetical protein VD973_03030 [Symbiobacteriaceae bacterium]|nr:hypothetical protein [Symbiobacteriaceae bacterium]
MTTNFDRYRKDLQDLIDKGERLLLAMDKECYPDDFKKAHKKAVGEKVDALIAALPVFTDTYQSWYSAAKAVIRQLLPDRLDDFVRHYEKPKARKEIDFENYRIEDYLQGLQVTRTTGLERKKVVGPDAAIPHFRQQLNMLKSANDRFESSLFDIHQLVQADLFDSELEAARALAKNGYLRAAGALAGVVLEKHLAEVCANHSLRLAKKAPCIADYNEALKAAEVIDIAAWRFVQHLGDIRNLCDHSKSKEPTKEQIDDLLTGVSKIIKTVF